MNKSDRIDILKHEKIGGTVIAIFKSPQKFAILY